METFICISCLKSDFEPDSINVGQGQESSFVTSIVSSEGRFLGDFFSIYVNNNILSSN